MSLGLTEIILIVLVILILFGGKRIPELAKALGKAQYEYKKAKEALEKEAKEFKETVNEVVEGEATKKTAAKENTAIDAENK